MRVHAHPSHLTFARDSNFPDFSKAMSFIGPPKPENLSLSASLSLGKTADSAMRMKLSVSKSGGL